MEVEGHEETKNWTCGVIFKRESSSVSIGKQITSIAINEKKQRLAREIAFTELFGDAVTK